MNGKVRDLSKYSQDDVEKLSLIENVLEEFPLRLSDSFAEYHIKNAIENECSMDSMFREDQLDHIGSYSLRPLTRRNDQIL